VRDFGVVVWEKIDGGVRDKKSGSEKIEPLPLIRRNRWKGAARAAFGHSLRSLDFAPPSPGLLLPYD
jgi:hypothetical protein